MASQKNVVPTAARARKIPRNVYQLFNRELVDWVFEDLSIPSSKIVGGVGSTFWLADVDNVLIVDPSGQNASAYTTWGAAMTAASDGDTILVTGQLGSEPQVTLKNGVTTMFLARFGIGSTTTAPIAVAPSTISHKLVGLGGRNIITHTAVANGEATILLEGSAQLEIHGLQIDRNSADAVIELEDTATLAMYNSNVTNSGAGEAILLAENGVKNLLLDDCNVIGGAYGVLGSNANGNVLDFVDSYIEGDTLVTGKGLELFFPGDPSSFVRRCDFVGAGNSVDVTFAAWNPAPFYQCTFDGTRNNLTVAAPAAAGSNWDI